MRERMDGHTTTPGLAERRWAAVDRVVGVGLLILGGLGLALALLSLASGLSGRLVHPDAVLLPLAAAVPLAGGGALFLLAAYAMRRRTTGRWTTQWAAIGLPTLVLLLLWLTLR